MNGEAFGGLNWWELILILLVLGGLIWFLVFKKDGSGPSPR